MPFNNKNNTTNALEDLELSRLLELLDANPIEPKVEKDETDVTAFMSALRLRPGRNPVPFRVIYQVYKLWSYKPTRRANLGKALSKYFKKRRTKYEVYYYLGNSF